MKKSLTAENIIEHIAACKGDSTWAAAILSHRSSIISTQNGHGYAYVPLQATQARIPLDGVTSVMSCALYHWAAKKARRPTVAAAKQYDKRAEARDKADLALLPGPLRSQMGHERGTMIHAQMDALINMDPETFLHIHRYGAHPWAVASLKTMVLGKGWLPLRAEFPVADLELGMATRIDMVACTGAGRIVVIEYKTGYAGGKFDREDRNEWSSPVLRRLAEVGVWPCTPRNRAIIQCMLGADMLRRMWRIPFPLEMLCLYVVRVSSKRFVEFIRIGTRLFDRFMPYLRHDIINRPRT